MHYPFQEIIVETSDEALVSSVRSGNKEAMECLLARHQPWIFNIDLRMLWRYQGAEDSTQDILIKIFNSMETLPFSPIISSAAVKGLLLAGRELACI